MDKLANNIAELVKSINEGLRSFGGALNKTYPEVWRVAVHQVKVEAWANIFIWLFISLVIFGVGIKFYYVHKKLKINRNSSDAESFYVRAWIFTCVSFVILVLNIGVNIRTILNPEYYAAKLVLQGVVNKE